MDLVNDHIAPHAMDLLRTATRIQLVHAPSFDIGFYQWLLGRARSGVKVEVLIAGQTTVQQTEMNTTYIQHLEQAGGRVFYLSEKKTLPVFILLDNVALFPQDNFNGINKGGLVVEEDINTFQKLCKQFDLWKETGRLISGIPQQGDNIDIFFQITPSYVDVNEHFELIWEVTGANDVAISPLPGLVSPKGRQVLSAEKSTEFCLTATNRDQVLSSVINVEVNPAAKIEYLLIAPGRTGKDDVPLQQQQGQPDRYGIVKGQILHLYWRVYNAEAVEIDGKKVLPVGNMTLNPDKNSAYTIAVSGKQGDATKTIMIEVFPQPEMERIEVLSAPAVTVGAFSSEQTSPAIEKNTGTAPTGTAHAPKARVFSVQEFFWFCSGASRQILRQCPTAEGNKYAGIGATIFFTGLLAALSGGYALYVAFQNPLAALAFGLLWGAAIFNLDRLIVSTIRKGAEQSQQWMQAFPRILLAIVLSIVIAKPMELRVFKPEIDEILSENRSQKLDRTEALFRNKATEMEQHIDKIKGETAASFQVREQSYQEYRCECDGTCGTGKVGRGTECARKEAKYRQSDSEYQVLKAGNDKLIASTRESLLELKTKEAAALLEVQRVHADGLVSRLAASQELPLMPSFFIALLIFLIEIAPVFSKILSPKGSYDDALSMEEARFGQIQEGLLQEQQAQKVQDSDLRGRLHQAEIDQKLDQKQEIMAIIADAQVQLVQEQVDRWLEEQREKMREQKST